MLRDFVIFLAGFQAFHTLTHLLVPYFIKLPLQTSVVTLTPALNILALIVNAAITLALIVLAYKMKKT